MKISAIRSTLAATGLALCMSTAHATLVTFTDTYTPSTPVFLTPTNKTYSFTQSILDDGFNSSTDTITGASLKLLFRDDGGPGDGAEKVSVTLDGLSLINNSDASSPLTYDLGSFKTILTDGMIAAMLTDVPVGGSGNIGDFYFDGAVLTVTANRVETFQTLAATNAVPEPGTLALAGLGLGCFGLMRRRKAKQA